MNTELSFDDLLRRRISQLRTSKGVSAREMSLSIGQGAAYINNIENGNSIPSMMVFFYICEYLKISPKDFFDFDCSAPAEANELLSAAKGLSGDTLGLLTALAAKLSRQERR